MIDLHCHVLPGIDDGARTLEEGAEMCRLAAAAGCTALVATPHQRRGDWWNCDRERLEALRRRLQEAVGASPRILPGGEIRVDSHLLGELLAWSEDAETGPLPLAGSRYLLLEFGPWQPAGAEDLIHELRIAGWRPILAHPELVPWMAGEPGMIERLVSLGALAQVTAMSLSGDFGRGPQLAVHRLIERGLVHFVASDAHDLERRPPGLERAWDILSTRYGENAARELLCDNPSAVLDNRPLPAELAPTALPEVAGP